MKLNAELLRPQVILLELIAARPPIEGKQQIKRGDERNAGKEYRRLADQQRLAVRYEHQDRGSHKGGKQDHAEKNTVRHGWVLLTVLSIAGSEGGGPLAAAVVGIARTA